MLGSSTSTALARPLTFKGTELDIALLRPFGSVGSEHGVRPCDCPEGAAPGAVDASRRLHRTATNHRWPPERHAPRTALAPPSGHHAARRSRSQLISLASRMGTPEEQPKRVRLHKRDLRGLSGSPCVAITLLARAGP